MRNLLNWLEHRTGYRELAREALYENIPGGSRWRYVWGSTLVFTFFVQVVTGMFLWMAYSPSSGTAWESVYFIQYQMQGGWLLRGIHHFTAQAMIVLLALHLMQVVIDRAYKAPREVNFWLGLILMQIVLGLSLTGYLLPWDQKGFWATRVATNLMTLVPVIGAGLQRLVVGGPDYGHATLTRFFALHAGVLPALLVGFLVLHIKVFRRHGIHAIDPKKGPDHSFWPDQILKDAVACLAVLAVILFFVVRGGITGLDPSIPVGAQLGAELGAPADAASPFSAARPEWYFLFLFQLLKYFHGETEVIGAIVLPGFVMFLLVLMPIVGRWKLGHRFNLALLFMVLGGAATLTFLAYNEDYQAHWKDPAQFSEVVAALDEIDTDLRDNKETSVYKGKKAAEQLILLAGDDDAKAKKLLADLKGYRAYQKSLEHIEAVETAERNRERVIELVRSPTGIPKTGAVDLLRADPKTQGPVLFERHCANCHNHVPRDGESTIEGLVAIESLEPTAPNLYHFGSKRWVQGFLDPEDIVSSDFFGSSDVHVAGEMVDFVEGDLQDEDEWTQEDKDNVILALAAEAGRLPDAEMDAARLVAGRKLIEDDNRCARCHRFHDVDPEYGAPDLTGYGSREWMISFISNPSHERFYGDNNDRMPSYAKDLNDPANNVLRARDIALVADWLRGQWYEPGDEEDDSDGENSDAGAAE